LFSSLVLAPAPVLAQALEGVFDVATGATTLACGGFAGTCVVYELSGSLAVAIDGDEASFENARLLLSNPLGQYGFPHDADLRFEELIGAVESGGRLSFRSPAGSFQTVELMLVPFTLGPGGRDGYTIFGSYDEGCCDRFVFDLSNVVLERREAGAPLSMLGGRFEINVDFVLPNDDVLQQASVRASGPQSGSFSFFDPDNPEIFVKFLDACAVFGQTWFFVAGLTNLEVVIEVQDEVTGLSTLFFGEAGTPFRSVIDTTTFPCS
jgi:hypothetical protein